MTKTDTQARINAIGDRILGVAGDIVDTVGQRAALRAQLRVQVEAAIYSEIAHFTCRKAACRRARRCRGEPVACIQRARADARLLSAGP